MRLTPETKSNHKSGRTCRPAGECLLVDPYGLIAASQLWFQLDAGCGGGRATWWGSCAWPGLPGPGAAGATSGAKNGGGWLGAGQRRRGPEGLLSASYIVGLFGTCLNAHCPLNPQGTIASVVRHGGDTQRPFRGGHGCQLKRKLVARCTSPWNLRSTDMHSASLLHVTAINILQFSLNASSCCFSRSTRASLPASSSCAQPRSAITPRTAPPAPWGAVGQTCALPPCQPPRSCCRALRQIATERQRAGEHNAVRAVRG